MSDYTIIERGEAHGLPYVIIQLQDERGPRHHCGYVGVPADHPFHGVRYDEAVPALVRRAAEASGVDPLILAQRSGGCGVPDMTPDRVLSVHGGVTWTDDAPSCGADDRATWWLGFDAAHSGDAMRPDEGGRPAWCGFTTYKNASYMRAECVSLARQLSEVVP